MIETVSYNYIVGFLLKQSPRIKHIHKLFVNVILHYPTPMSMPCQTKFTSNGHVISSGYQTQELLLRDIFLQLFAFSLYNRLNIL